MNKGRVFCQFCGFKTFKNLQLAYNLHRIRYYTVKKHLSMPEMQNQMNYRHLKGKINQFL